MEVHYQREMTHNYMIIRAETPEWGENYSCHMMEENGIPGLLAFQTRHTGQNVDYYYEITSRQPLSRLFERRKPDGEMIRRVVSQILDTLWVLEEYLLVEEGILLEPSYIYADPDTMELSLCFVPGMTADFTEKMKDFLRWLMERADHRDSKAVMLSYDLYEASLRENYGAEDLRRCLDGSRSSIFREKEIPKVPEEERFPAESEACCAVCGRNHGRSSAAPERGYDPYPPEQEKAAAEGGIEAENPGSALSLADLAHAHGPALSLSAGFAAELVIWFMTGFQGIGFYAGILCGALTLVLTVFRLTSLRKTVLRDPAEDGDESPEWEEIPGPERIFPERMDPVLNFGRRKPEETPRDNGPENPEKPEKDGPYAELIPEYSALEYPENENRRIGIFYTPFLIGQNPDLTDFCLPDPAVSPMHLRIDRDKQSGEYMVQDLNSENGTLVDGKELCANEWEILRDGGRLRIAGLEYRFAVKTDPVVV